MTPLEPSATAAHTIFRLAAAEKPGGIRWLVLGALALFGWLGAIAALGRARPSGVSRLLDAWFGLGTVFWTSATAIALVLAIMSIRRDRAGAYVSATVLAFVFGQPIYAAGAQLLWEPAGGRVPLEDLGDAWPFAVARLRWCASFLVPMIVVWLLAGRPVMRLELGLGDWRAKARDFSSGSVSVSWRRVVFGGYVVAMLVLFVIFQASVGFAPLLSGALWPLVPAILVAALANATAEELVFRGMLQRALIGYGGVGAGLWIQGLVFGLVHWGASIGLVGSLPIALATGFVSVYWGRAAYETRGLALPIAAHCMADVVLFSAYFVPHQ